MASRSGVGAVSDISVYLAAPYVARGLMRAYRDELTTIGFKVVSRWIDEGHEVGPGTIGAAADLTDEDAKKHADQDLRDVMQAHVLVAFTSDAAPGPDGKPGGFSGGRHIETGYALANGTSVIVVGEPENIFHRLGPPRVQIVPDWHAAVVELSARLVARRVTRDLPRAEATP
jgi:hypothetical protein